MSAAPGNANRTFTFTVFKNGATTGITCAITNAATTCSDTTHSTTFAAGDKVAVRVARSGSDVVSQGRTFTFVLDASGAVQLGSPHTTMGTAVLAAGVATVTFGGASAFTSGTSYLCNVTDVGVTAVSPHYYVT